MIVGQINRTVTLVVELLHFAQDMFRRPEPPLAVGQRRNVAINAGVRTAARSLHRAKFFQRQDGRHIKRQGFDVVNGQRRPVGIRKLVQILDDRAGDVFDDFLAVAPDQASDFGRVVEMVQIVRQQFLAFADAHGVNPRTILQNPFLVHRGENAAADDRHIRHHAFDHLRHAFDAGISCRGQKREGHDVWRIIPQRLCDVRLLHLRMAGVEHADLMAMLAQDRCERLDAQRRESHHLDARVAWLRAAQIFRQQPVEILVIDPNEEYFHKQRPFLVRRLTGGGWVVATGERSGRLRRSPPPRASRLMFTIWCNRVRRFYNGNGPNETQNPRPGNLKENDCKVQLRLILPFRAGNATPFLAVS